MDEYIWLLFRVYDVYFFTDSYLAGKSSPGSSDPSMGIFLAPIMVALGAFAGIIQTRKIGIAWKLLDGCIPCIILTGIYLLLRVEGMG